MVSGGRGAGGGEVSRNSCQSSKTRPLMLQGMLGQEVAISKMASSLSDEEFNRMQVNIGNNPTH